MGCNPCGLIGVPPAGAGATRDLALTWLAWFIPISLISAAVLSLTVWFLIRLRGRRDSSATFATGRTYEKAMIMDTISGYFFCAGYKKTSREENEITFARDSKYDLVLGALLFLFFMLPGVLYLLVFGREHLGRVICAGHYRRLHSGLRGP